MNHHCNTKKDISVTDEVVTAVSMEIIVFKDIMQCSLVHIRKHFREHCLPPSLRSMNVFVLMLPGIAAVYLFGPELIPEVETPTQQILSLTKIG